MAPDIAEATIFSFLISIDAILSKLIILSAISSNLFKYFFSLIFITFIVYQFFSIKSKYNLLKSSSVKMGISSFLAVTHFELVLLTSLLINISVFLLTDPITCPPCASILFLSSVLFLYNFKLPVITTFLPDKFCSTCFSTSGSLKVIYPFLIKLSAKEKLNFKKVVLTKKLNYNYNI